MAIHFLFLLSLTGLTTAGLPPEVVLPSLGTLRGSLGSSAKGRQFFSFMSIPYAKPPVEELRFQSPQRPLKWDGVLDASGDRSPMCMQIPIFIPSLRNLTLGQEDCLYLNVFTRKIDSSAKLPVMVYIHGGAFRFGSPGPKGRATYLMDREMVLVTLTYRLGPLGFLSTEDEVIPGNFGLKDQAMVLGWVKRNIEHFGGDPDSITIFGESAGGASVHYMMMSPLSKGLFNRAISESGTATAPWSSAARGSARVNAHRLAQELNCPTNSHSDMLDCLLKLDAKTLTAVELLFKEYNFNPSIIFKPVVESNKVCDAFINFDPMTSVTTVPWIQGMNSFEGALIIATLISYTKEDMERYIDIYEQLLPYNLKYKGRVKDENELTRKVKERYFSTGKPTPRDIGNIFSDGLILWPSYVASKNHKGPQWYYYFDHKGQRSLYDLGDFQDPGVGHGEELLYLFDYQDAFNFNVSEQDNAVSEKLINLWVNFAKYGNPTPGNSEVKWMNHGKEREYLHMKTYEFTMGKKLLDDELSFWNNLTLQPKMGTGKEEL